MLARSSRIPKGKVPFRICMARFEFVMTQIWDDAWFLSLSSVERLAFQYLLTCPERRPAGIFPLALQIWAIRVGVDITEMTAIKDRFVQDGKIAYDEQKGVVWVVNAWRHNVNNHQPNSIEAAKKNLLSFANCSFFNDVCKAYPSLSEGLGKASESLPLGKVRIGKGREGKVVKNVVVEKHGKATPIDEFATRYEQHTGSKCVVNGGKDGKLLGAIERQLGREEYCRRLESFFTSHDEFITKAGFTVGVFSSQVNKLSGVLGRFAGLKAFAEKMRRDP